MNTSRKRLKKLFRKLVLKYRNYTSFVRLMPDFLIIGIQRGGTSSLYNYMIQHPCILPARKKEVHYFDRNFKKGNRWYRSNFPMVFHKWIIKLFRRVSLTGEASPYYIFYPHAVERIHKILPDIKLICILRNPVERAFSHYCHSVRKGREKLTFEEAITTESERLNEELQKLIKDPYHLSYNYQKFSYITRGHYEEQLKIWFKLFKREQFLFIRSEDFFKYTEAQLNRVFRFLGLKEYKLRKYKRFGTSKKETDIMNKETREQLVKYYDPYNKRLYSLVGIDFKWE